MKTTLNPFENAKRTAKGTGGGTITPATSETLGGVKIGEGVNVTEDGTISVPSYVPPAYSTDEVDTLLLWIDGKRIYRKVVDVGTLPNATTKQVAHGISYDTIVNLKGVCSNSDNAFLPIPAVATSSQYSIELSLDVTNVVITTAQDRSAFSGYVIIEYTKPSV